MNVSLILLQARRREQNRLQRIEEAAKMAEEKDNLQQKRKLYQIEADERTKKNRYTSVNVIKIFVFIRLRV